MLHDFTFRSPDEIFAELKKPKTGATTSMTMPGMTGMHMQGGSMRGMAGMGTAGMTMDLNDVVYDAFLANDRTLEDPDVVRVEPGGRVLLRIINGASASNFFLDLGVLTGEVVAVDGHAVRPVSASVFPIAIAQRLDVRVQLPKGPTTAFPVLATLEGERKRTGIVLAAPNAKIVKIDPLAVGLDVLAFIGIGSSRPCSELIGALRAMAIETVEAILLTHCHFDHIGAVAPVASRAASPASTRLVITCTMTSRATSAASPGCIPAPSSAAFKRW